MGRNFWSVFSIQFFGALNDNLYKQTIVLLITFEVFKIGNMDINQMIALAGGAFILPFFLFSSFSGELALKVSKTKLIENEMKPMHI